MLTNSRSATAVLEESFLEMRAKLLEVAADLDRIDRAASLVAPLAEDAVARREQLDEATRLLLEAGPERAAALQLLFSRRYESDWRQSMSLDDERE